MIDRNGGPWITTASLSAIFGPLLGGVLIEASWRWLFLVNLPVCLLALAGAARWVPNAKHEQNTPASRRTRGGLLIVGIGASRWVRSKAPIGAVLEDVPVLDDLAVVVWDEASQRRNRPPQRTGRPLGVAKFP